MIQVPESEGHDVLAQRNCYCIGYGTPVEVLLKIKAEVP